METARVIPMRVPTKLPPIQRTQARPMRLPRPVSWRILPSANPPMTMMGTSESHGEYTTCCFTPHRTMYSTGRTSPTATSFMASIAHMQTAHVVMARNMAISYVTA